MNATENRNVMHLACKHDHLRATTVRFCFFTTESLHFLSWLHLSVLLALGLQPLWCVLCSVTLRASPCL